MKMTALEKHFVNGPRHTRKVTARTLSLLDRIEHKDGWQYLDVGCGVGAAASAIANATNLEVTAVDVDPEQIAAAQAGPGRPNLHFRVMDATRLDFRDSEFDIVATSLATHHIPGWERAFSEMARVLREGGYLVYSDFVVTPWVAKIVRLIRRADFPLTSVLDSLAAKGALVKVYEAKHYMRRDLIWRKAASPL